MPRYDFQCVSCGFTEERCVSLSCLDDPISCESCGGKTKRLISKSMVSPDWEPYVEENMGHDPVVVKSRQHYKQLLVERGITNRYGVGQQGQRWV